MVVDDPVEVHRLLANDLRLMTANVRRAAADMLLICLSEA